MADLGYLGTMGGMTREKIDKLISVRKEPIDKLEKNKKLEETRLTAYAQLTKNLNALRKNLETLSSPSSLSLFKAMSGDEKKVIATAAEGALAGHYEVTVQQLAKNHQLTSPVINQADAANKYFTNDSQLQLTLDQTPPLSLAIDVKKDSTLTDIAAAINQKAPANQHVFAEVLALGDGTVQFSIRSRATGEASSFSLASADPGAPSWLVPASAGTMQVALQAQDAKFIVNGSPFTAPKNDVKVSNVSLTLVSVSEPLPLEDPSKPDQLKWKPTTITLMQDDAQAKARVQAFAEAYNTVLTHIDTNSNFADERLKIEGGPFSKESEARAIRRQLQSILNGSVPGGRFTRLDQIGIGFTLDDAADVKRLKLEFDGEAFDKAWKQDPSAVQNLFSGTNGIAENMRFTTFEMTKAEGTVTLRSDSVKQRINQLADKIFKKEQDLIKYGEQLERDSVKLDKQMAMMNAQSEYLTVQLSQMFQG